MPRVSGRSGDKGREGGGGGMDASEGQHWRRGGGEGVWGGGFRGNCQFVRLRCLVGFGSAFAFHAFNCNYVAGHAASADFYVRLHGRCFEGRVGLPILGGGG